MPLIDMSYNNLWRPDPSDRVVYIKPKKKPKKKKRKKNKSGWREIYDYLRKHYRLHKGATPLAICHVINRELEDEMPGNKHEYRAYAKRQYKILAETNKAGRRYFRTDDKFYSSQAWRELRYIALSNAGGCCQLCGARASDGVQIHVDHIKPRSKFPKLEMDLDNLQILCSDCNRGKSNFDDENWRQHWESI